MPYSFTKIEEEKSKTITFVFSFLVLTYFISIWLIVFLVKNLYGKEELLAGYYSKVDPTIHPLGFAETLTVFAIAFVVSYVHWRITTYDIISKILKILKAQEINVQDTYHKMFKNIIEEVSVATGGKKIDGVVVPSMAMNAFAIADLKGNAVIGVTEGLLSRLSRPQVEAVVGHEAAHVVSGDCVTTTITSSMFQLYSAILKAVEKMLGRGGRYSGRNFIILIPIYLLLALTHAMNNLMRMFISRQREYRADAVAVRLTRDPLALSEALYSISYHWRGAGLPAEELDSIFTVSPKYQMLDESENPFADFFATHPPIDERLRILTNMAHSNLNAVADNVEKLDNRPRVAVPQTKVSKQEWMVNRDGKWDGPFDIQKMLTFDWLRPEIWVQKVGGTVNMAFEDAELTKMMFNKEGKSGPCMCPKCNVPFHKVVYEGVEVDKCSFCEGVFVHKDDVQKFIVRREIGFPERIVRMAQIYKKQDTPAWGGNLKINRDPKTLYRCPHPDCQKNKVTMLRAFYTESYHIEVDKCIYCNNIWFDKDELEILQCLIEDVQHAHQIKEG